MSRHKIKNRKVSKDKSFLYMPEKRDIERSRLMSDTGIDYGCFQKSAEEKLLLKVLKAQYKYDRVIKLKAT